MFRTAQMMHHCKRCGRELIRGESCPCVDDVGPDGRVKDGMRARCPEFRYRSSYGGRCYLVCGRVAEVKRGYLSRQDRDAHYRAHCCGDWKTCPFVEKE